MSSAQGLSRQQKGKSVAAASAPARSSGGGCIGGLESTHHEAMMDTVDLSRSQRLLVADATWLAREGNEKFVVRDATECARDGQSGAVPVDSITLRARVVEGDPSEDDDSEAELFPTTFYPEGIFEELPRLHPDLLRPAYVAGQDWDGVEETKSTLRSVKRVLRAQNATGVTFLIPRKEQRPWSPPIGYQTVYESFFQDDTRCWFPIPRLIAAYARRRDLAISQLLNGSLRLAVTLSVMAEEIDMPMSVRSFEEMTSITDMKDGTFSNWQRSYFFIKSDDSAFEEPPREDYRVLWNRSCVGHPTSPVYPEGFLKSVRAVALLRIYRWSEITVEKIRELKDRIARRLWRSNLPTVLPIRTKRLDIFPKNIQKQVSEAKRLGTLPDLSAMLAAQLGLASEEGPSATVPRTGEVPPSGARSAGKGKKKKRGGSGVEGSAEEASDVPPSGEPQKKKKKKKKRTKRPVDEQSENPEEPTEIEEGDVQEEELQPEEEVSEAEISRERDDAAEAGEGEESEIPLNVARPDGSEDDSGESPLLIRRRNDEVGDEGRSPILASSREGTPVPIGAGVAQIGTSSRGSAILRRVPGVNYPDKVSFHYEGPAPLVYVPEACGEFLRQLRGRAKPLPAVKDLIFGGEYEEAARAKLLGDSATNVMIDKYDTALKGALGELELAKKEHVAKEEASARQLNASKADVERLNGMVARIIARRDELKAELEVSRGVVCELERKNAELEGEKVSLAESHEREMRRLRDSRILEVTRERGRVEAEAERAAKANRRFARIRSREERRGPYEEARLLHSQAFGTRKCLEALRRAGSDISQATIEIFAEQEKIYEEEAEKLRVGEIPEEDLTLSPLVLDSQFVDARILASLDPYGSNAGLIDPETAASLHVPPTHPTEERREDPAPLLEGPLADPEVVPRPDEAHVSPAARESSVRASELSVLNDHESDREA
ncbi:meiosis-specific protein ASY2-like [Brassica napus]|uniref:meiosis-specific protein ASY2-like n=1 Tax=Brassica napus TaxID=3708 RepID=UPI00207B0C7B|nr:meiosis-specific protein ASY2-like [Brassica napus]